MNGKTAELTVIVALLILILGCGERESNGNPVDAVDPEKVEGEIVAFVDSSLEAAVREALRKVDGDLTDAELLALTRLEARGRGIAELSGIERMENLKVLDLAENRIGDIAPLADLDSLILLDLSGNPLGDIAPLAGLPQLESLIFEATAVEDIGVLLELPVLQNAEMTGCPLDSLSLRDYLPALEERGVQIGYIVMEESPGEIETEVPPELQGVYGRIVFSSDRAGNYDIYVMDADGGRVWEVTEDPEEDRSPDWSPDGKRIAITRGRVKGDIYVVGEGGGTAVNLTQGEGDNRSPSWSPDGSRILFSRATPETWRNIFVMAADGSEVRQLTDYSGDIEAPVWSPDGSQILFLSRREGDTWPMTYAMDVAGGQARRIGDNDVAPRTPRWSPDGSVILFAAGVPIRRSEGGGWAWTRALFVMDADGGNRRELSQEWVADAAWMMEGRKIMFGEVVNFRSQGEAFDLFIQDLNGGNKFDLTNNAEADDREPDWTAVE